MSAKTKKPDRKKKLLKKIKRALFSKKSLKGSVTIFLVILMLPMFIFSFSIVDFCKVLLSSQITQSAEDVAMNSALTSYDKALKDMYGLLASSANEEELTEKVKDYYIATLESNGISVSNEDKSNISKLITNFFDNGIPDSLGDNGSFLKLYSTDIPGGTSPIKVSPISSSSISNPAVMKRQIVEYMKYRGPVYLTAGVLDKINAFKDVSNQTNATNAKLDFEETLSDINNDGIKAYVLFELFFANNDEMESKISNPQIPYPNEKTAKKLIENYKYDVTTDMNFGLWYKNGEIVLEDDNMWSLAGRALAYGMAANSYKEMGNLVFVDSVNKVLNSSQITEHKYDNIKSITSDLLLVSDNAKSFKELDVYTFSFILDDLDKFTKLNSNINISGLEEDFKFIQAYAPLFKGSDPAVYKNTKSDFARYMKEDFANAYIKAVELQTYIDNHPDSTDFSEDDIKALDDAISDADKDVVDVLSKGTDRFKSYVNKWHNDAVNYFNMCRSKFKELYTVCKTQYAIVYELTKDNGVLDQIYEKFKTAQTQAEDYSTKVNAVQTESVKASFEAQYVNEAKDIKELDINDVLSLKNELKKQGEVYKKVVETLDNITYFGKSLGKQIMTNDKLTIDMIMSDFTKNGGYKEGINTNYEAAFLGSNHVTSFKTDNISQWNNSTLKKNITDNVIYKKIVEIGVPKEKKEDNEDAKELKKDITDNGGAQDGESIAKNTKNDESSSSTDDFSPGDEKYKTFTEYINDIKEENKTEGNDKTEGDDEDKKFDMGEDKKAKNSAKSAMSSVGTFFGDLAKAARDDLYITEYLTENFTCFTTNKNNDKKDEAMISGYKFYEDDKEKVVWYDGELEYILYGNSSKELNVAAAGGIIFGIRFALNLVYSFTDTEIRNTTFSIATAVGGWLPFSVPLIQAVLHIGLSLAESAYDLMRLLDGDSVPIFKTQATWVCKGSNLVKKVAEEVVENVSDYAIDTFSEKLNEQIEKYGDDISGLAVDKIEGFDKLVEEQVISVATQVKNDIITPLTDTINQLILLCRNDKETIRQTLSETLQLLKSQLISQAPKDNDFIGKIETEVLNSIDVNKIADLVCAEFDDIADAHNSVKKDTYANVQEGSVDVVLEKINNVLKSVEDKIDEAVKKYEEISGGIKDKVKESVQAIVTEAQESIEKGAKTLKDKISSSLNKSIRGHEDYDINYGGKAKNSAMISMDYKDYLYIFTLIGLIANENAMLERAAILMSANVSKETGASYDTNKAYTLFEGTAASQVRTIFWGTYWDKDGNRWIFPADNRYTVVRHSYVGY